MDTEQKTRAQLREAIAEKRGFQAVRTIDGVGASRLFGWREDSDALELIPDYLNSMDAAMPLLRELPGYVLTAALVTWRTGGSLGYKVVHIEIGKEAEAISCAWWQWKTGEVVELVEES